MDNSKTRLLIYSMLMTLGVILILLGISWLMFLGAALIVLAAFFSSKQKAGSRRLMGFLLYAAGAVVFLFWDMHDGYAFAQKKPPIWAWVLIIGAGLGGIISEFWRWRKYSHDA
jgi:hypothetical protein